MLIPNTTWDCCTVTPINQLLDHIQDWNDVAAGVTGCAYAVYAARGSLVALDCLDGGSAQAMLFKKTGPRRSPKALGKVDRQPRHLLCNVWRRLCEPAQY